jgi:hypothetical protein
MGGNTKIVGKDLFPAAADVVVSDFIEALLFIFARDGVAFAMDNGVLGDDAVLGRIDLDDLELDGPHTSADGEQVALPDRSVGFEKVWFEINIEQRSGEALDAVGDGEDGDALGVFDVGA